MKQQLRYNEGKTKHSYFFASKTAINMLDDECGTACLEEACTYYAEALDEIAAFLDGDDCALPGAAVALMQGLQVEATGEEGGHRGLHPAVFLAHVPAALDAYGAVCEYGEAKYARGNYRKGAPVTQYFDSALRHLLSRLRGELNDPESGKPHGGHALWNVIQAMEQPEFRDDRLPPVKQTPDKPVAVTAPSLADELPPVPVTFDVVEAERCMRNGKTVKCVVNDGTKVNVGIRLRFVDGKFWFVSTCGLTPSTFPRDYENATFEVVS